MRNWQENAMSPVWKSIHRFIQIKRLTAESDAGNLRASIETG
jgi:hypothetical protein